MASKFRLTYHTRLFLTLLGLSWVLVACFIWFQYHREKQYKVEMLDAQLQLYNTHLIDALSNDSIDFHTVAHHQPIPGLRVSIIGTDGKLQFDNSLDTLPAESHLTRPEIAQAMATGHGCTLRRHSAVTDQTYFYSATRGPGVVVRSAAPYSLSLQHVLEADRSFLRFMAVVTLAVSILGYFATRNIGRTITRLNQFAAKAEKGEPVYDEEAFPPDELGSISNHIIRLYARLQHTKAECDNEHHRVLMEQEEKNRFKKQLTNNINHELKTPVASIKVCLETILTHRNLPPEKHWNFVEQCYHHTERLTNLLNDVASITRMDDGAVNIQKEQLDLTEIISEVQAAVAQHVENAGMLLTITTPQSMPITGNRSYLTSIFRNLIDNAIAYSGGSLITINLTANTDREYTLTLSDDGCGIPADHLERIFERFYRIDKGRSRQMGGTGLGLSIVRNAVQLHGGHIIATNLRPHGLQFTLTLCKT